MLVRRPTTTTRSDWYHRNRILNHLLDRELRREHPAKGLIVDRIPGPSELLAFVRNLARIQGVPRVTRIDFASVGDKGAAAAGFSDLPHGFEEPFILLDGKYRSLDAADCLACYGGLGLHEAGHIVYTRLGYLRKQQRNRSERESLYDNLLEDERIEERIRGDSPGYRSFLQHTKRLLLVQGSVGQALTSWSQLPDLDKIESLIFAFIRLPHRISAELEGWTAINGECVLATLRSLLPAAPATEEDVEQMAKRICSMFERLREHYPSGGKTIADDRFNTDVSTLKRALQQVEANAEDEAHQYDDPEPAAEKIFEEARQLEASADGCCDPKAVKATASRMLEQAAAIASEGSMPKRDRRRFGRQDATELLRQMESIQEACRDDGPNRSRSTDERMEFGSAWEWDGTRKTKIIFPDPSVASNDRYDDAREAVASEIVNLRQVLQLLRSRDGTTIIRERNRGQIDKRRIARGMIDTRIFKKRQTKRAPGMGLCLLLDESSSMHPHAERQALRVAVMITEATAGHAGVELEIYSHSTCGPGHRDCRIQYLFGKRNRDRRSIGSYSSRGANYDHQAIKTAADLFRQNCKLPRPIMIVVSDGAPRGLCYEGPPAIAATRDAVQQLRRQGMQVLNVAINDYESEQIFGPEYVLKFTRLATFVPDFRRFMTRVVRSIRS